MDIRQSLETDVLVAFIVVVIHCFKLHFCIIIDNDDDDDDDGDDDGDGDDDDDGDDNDECMAFADQPYETKDTATSW